LTVLLEAGTKQREKLNLQVQDASYIRQAIGVSVETLGTDMMFLAGGGIHGHPDGSTAGARAMMAAVRAAVAGMPLNEAAQKNPELLRALSTLQLK
jgi:ribulose 1,5-bisphosphate carboxylase large subunit-like protein